MIEVLFTIDYEIYGNGGGSLRDHVLEPAERLRAVFQRHGCRFVNFVEALEFEQIERQSSDPAAARVRQQVRELHLEGHEIALHLHPQWANARWRDGGWDLDYSEYNLCVLPPPRIAEIVDRGIAWLRDAVGGSGFGPVSFRAGNWLFQPTRDAAAVLARRGIRVDSSVFKGGRQHAHRLDYRRARKLGWSWRFQDDVTVETPAGHLLEVPIHTELVPFWRMITGKRLALQQKGDTTGRGRPAAAGRLSKLLDRLRPLYPLKHDFCRMSLAEMVAMTERVLRLDALTPAVPKPVVSIGHTKDLVDLDAIDSYLGWLRDRGIAVTTFRDLLNRLAPAPASPALHGLS